MLYVLRSKIFPNVSARKVSAGEKAGYPLENIRQELPQGSPKGQKILRSKIASGVMPARQVNFRMHCHV